VYESIALCPVSITIIGDVGREKVFQAYRIEILCEWYIDEIRDSFFHKQSEHHVRSLIRKYGKTLDLIELVDRRVYLYNMIIYRYSRDIGIIIFEKYVHSCKEKCHDRHEI
jgi:hypothetical protein